MTEVKPLLLMRRNLRPTKVRMKVPNGDSLRKKILVKQGVAAFPSLLVQFVVKLPNPLTACLFKAARILAGAIRHRTGKDTHAGFQMFTTELGTDPGAGFRCATKSLD